MHITPQLYVLTIYIFDKFLVEHENRFDTVVCLGAASIIVFNYYTDAFNRGCNNHRCGIVINYSTSQY